MSEVSAALHQLIHEGLVEEEPKGHFRLTNAGREYARRASAACPHCPHCIASQGTLAANDPALTTNKATTSRPCRDCGEKGREASTTRHDICKRCMRVRARVIAGVKDKTVTDEQFRRYQKNGLRFKRLQKIGLHHLIDDRPEAA